MKNIKRILLVFGTRPEAIKMGPLVKEFHKFPDHFKTIVCVTAQHREMLDQVLNLFEIIPDYDLDIMKEGQDLFDLTSRVLTGMRDVINEANPDLILVHGDTSTSTAAALAAFYLQIPVGHIEAGLRTNNIYSPWPEEMNRQITGRITTFHFAPTDLSKLNLLNEGIKDEKVFVTGNTVIDALHWVLKKIKISTELQNNIKETLESTGISEEKINAWQVQKGHIDPTIKDNINARKMVLITGHRRENFGQSFIDICLSIKELSDDFPEVDFVYPMHKNPNVRNAINQVFDLNREKNANNSNVYFLEPLEYLPFIYLMNSSFLILTDSGGIQEEAPGLGIPVLVMRNNTERPEAVDAGTVKLVGTNKETIKSEVSKLLKFRSEYEMMSLSINPYGNGFASNQIVNHLFRLMF